MAFLMRNITHVHCRTFRKYRKTQRRKFRSPIILPLRTPFTFWGAFFSYCFICAFSMFMNTHMGSLLDTLHVTNCEPAGMPGGGRFICPVFKIFTILKFFLKMIETTQVLISWWWMSKWNVIHPEEVISFNSRKGWRADSRCNMDKPQQHYAKWKRPDAEDHKLHDSICMKCPEKTNLERQKVN